jgi:hypothetical protein
MSYRSAPLLPIALAALTLQASCVVYGQPSCRVGADCASGICNSDGTCGESGSGGGKGTNSATSSGSGASAVCTPGDPGLITRAEVPLQAGLHATFLSAENAPVNTAGTMNPNGSRAWDLTATLSGDHSESVETLALDAQWFGKDFPGAAYAARLSDAADLLGVFALTDTELQLVGVASPAGDNPQTELHYSPPVTVLAFPLQLNANWTTTSMVTGQAEGVTVFYTENYQNAVDAYGTLKTPYASFNVLRVDTLLTRAVGAVVTTTRTFSFVTACFGDVASVVSNTDEPVQEFTTAAVVSRLTP